MKLYIALSTEDSDKMKKTDGKKERHPELVSGSLFHELDSGLVSGMTCFFGIAAVRFFHSMLAVHVLSLLFVTQKKP